MLVQHVSMKVVCPLDSMSSDTHTSFNWTIDTVTEVHGTVVSVQSLLRLKGSRPRAIWGLTGKSVKLFATVSYPLHYNAGCLDKDTMGMEMVENYAS